MKSVILSYLMTGLAACGSAYDDPPEFTKTVYTAPEEEPVPAPVPEDVQEFVDLFYAYAEDYGRPNLREVPFIFKDQEAGVAGTCLSGIGIGVQIELDPDVWQKMGWYQKVELVAHELGHCVLNRDHVDQTAVSMLTPSLHDEYFLFYNWDELWAEMFKTVQPDEMLNLIDDEIIYSHKGCNHE